MLDRPAKIEVAWKAASGRGTTTSSAASGRPPRRAGISPTKAQSTERRSAKWRGRTRRTSSGRSTPRTRAKVKWALTSPSERAKLLNTIADRIEDNLELLAEVETRDNGKPIRESMNADVPLSADHFRYFASCIRAEEGSICEIDHDTIAYHFKEPFGVVGQIIPWNFPLLMAAWKLAPALAAGNCVVIKPASDTPMSLAVLMDVIGDVLPAGVLNVVFGHGSEVGAPLAKQPEDRQDRLHRRDDDRPADHAICGGDDHPDDVGIGRQVAQHLLRRRHGQGRRVP